MRHLCILSSLCALALSCDGPTERQRITIKGSDTMVILGQRWAERYMEGHPDTAVQVTGGGSGTGIAALISGSTDICQSSRPMKDKERQDVKSKQGKDVVEFAVALDGLALYCHESNPVTELTIEQIRDVYTAKITTWDDLGFTGGGAIVTYSRENSSGTYMYFKEHVLKDADFHERVQTLPGTSNVVNAVSKDPKSIGYGGIAYSKGIKAIKVKRDAAAEGLEPTMENVVSGVYPISRKLFFYTAGTPSPAVQSFIDWILSPEGQKIVETVGYYPLPK
jgi:phosphate transport system substrate-binding protein